MKTNDGTLEGEMLSEGEIEAIMAPVVEATKKGFKDKRFGDLLHEMFQMIRRKPELLDPGYKKGDKHVYRAYVDEINRREEAFYASLDPTS